ncbi:hypothetical protein [Bdellovibrio sp. HCB274]|uniref:hypothetical protein n=1 Tax=Bdellovibrio sp. HCB274 TaxID=3394361 RepID=UPI0039B67149
MNNKFNAPMMILVTAVALMGVGCGNNKMVVAGSNQVVSSGNNNTGTIPTSPDGSTGTDTGTGNTTTYSNEAKFTPVSMNELNAYVGTRPLNDPQDIKLKVQLTQVGSTGRYAGSVSLSYTDTGLRYTGTFSTDSGKNASYSGLKDNNTLEAEYNRWFTSGGKSVFTGFFQDQWGAVVLVIDNAVSQGDVSGGGGVIVTGSLYYKNFAQSYAQQSPYRKCWFIYDGPYNCRAGAVINKSAVYPGDGYKKLGTFSGISKTAAFQ